MEIFSASLSVEPSQETEFRAQFEQTTESWGEFPQFLWSSLLSSSDSNSKFIICTGWNTSDNRAFTQGLETLKQFQQMFERVEEFQSIDIFENRPEVQTNEVSNPVENIVQASEDSKEEEPEDIELPIDLQTGVPANWIENGTPIAEETFPKASPPLRKSESSTLLADFLETYVSVWTRDRQSTYHDEGRLISCDEHWIQILDGSDQTLLFPTTGVRLIKIHE